MNEIAGSIETTGAEEKAGFSVQPIDYPETYELPRLGGKSSVRHERAIALVIDDANRIRRRKSGDGYIHEALTETGWTIQETFESLDEVIRHPVYVSWRRASARDESGETGDDQLE
jgi:hypothetical protein